MSDNDDNPVAEGPLQQRVRANRGNRRTLATTLLSIPADIDGETDEDQRAILQSDDRQSGASFGIYNSLTNNYSEIFGPEAVSNKGRKSEETRTQHFSKAFYTIHDSFNPNGIVEEGQDLSEGHIERAENLRTRHYQNQRYKDGKNRPSETYSGKATVNSKKPN